MASPKYKLGIAFSGGGAKGAAHCGALQAFEEFGIKADAVAGTSAGSIVATLYACGVKPLDMCNMFGAMEFKDLLGVSMPKGGLFDSKPLVEHLRKVIPVKNFEDLPMPLYVVASNIDKGKAVIFTKGELAPRVCASCSIPVIFKPMLLSGSHYVDGGLFMNLPVSPLRDKCEKVIALSVNHASEEKPGNNLVAVALKSFHLMFLANAFLDAAKSDLYIELNTLNYNAYDMAHIKEMFEIGYNTTVLKLEEAGYKRIKDPEKLSFVQKDSNLKELRAKIKSLPSHIPTAKKFLPRKKEE